MTFKIGNWPSLYHNTVYLKIVQIFLRLVEYLCKISQWTKIWSMQMNLWSHLTKTLLISVEQCNNVNSILYLQDLSFKLNPTSVLGAQNPNFAPERPCGLKPQAGWHKLGVSFLISKGAIFQHFPLWVCSQREGRDITRQQPGGSALGLVMLDCVLIYVSWSSQTWWVEQGREREAGEPLTLFEQS